MSQKRWIYVIGVGIAYGVVGVLFGEIAKRVAGDQSRAWRLGAWVVSAAIYAGHFAYEQFRIKQRSIEVAVRLAIAVGFGGFLLAVAAGVHAIFVGTQAPMWLYGVALIAWPIFTGVPAFVVSLIASYFLTRFRKAMR